MGLCTAWFRCFGPDPAYARALSALVENLHVGGAGLHVGHMIHTFPEAVRIIGESEIVSRSFATTRGRYLRKNLFNPPLPTVGSYSCSS